MLALIGEQLGLSRCSARVRELARRPGFTQMINLLWCRGNGGRRGAA
jgi:hypothetical protein